VFEAFHFHQRVTYLPTPVTTYRPDVYIHNSSKYIPRSFVMGNICFKTPGLSDMQTNNSLLCLL